MTILIVDDEPEIRALIAAMLAASGDQPLQAENGDEALRILEGRGGAVDLVITDIVMPHMDGFALAEEIWRARPDVKVLFISGQCSPARLRDHLSRRSAYLAKPFARAALLRAVRDLVTGDGLRRTAHYRSRSELAGLRGLRPPRPHGLEAIRRRSERALRRRYAAANDLNLAFRKLCIAWDEARRIAGSTGR